MLRDILLCSANRWTTGNIWVKGDGNLVAGNIKKGVNIFGVTGTYDGYMATFNNDSLWYVMPQMPAPVSYEASITHNFSGTTTEWNQLQDVAAQTIVGVGLNKIPWSKNRCYTGVYYFSWYKSTGYSRDSEWLSGSIQVRTCLPTDVLQNAKKLTIKWTLNIPKMISFSGSVKGEDSWYDITGIPTAYLSLNKWNRDVTFSSGNANWSWYFSFVKNLAVVFGPMDSKVVTGVSEFENPYELLKPNRIVTTQDPGYWYRSSNSIYPANYRTPYKETYVNTTPASNITPIMFTCGIDVRHQIVWDYQPSDSDSHTTDFYAREMTHYVKGPYANVTMYGPIDATIDSVVLSK